MAYSGHNYGSMRSSDEYNIRNLTRDQDDAKAIQIALGDYYAEHKNTSIRLGWSKDRYGADGNFGPMSTTYFSRLSTEEQRAVLVSAGLIAQDPQAAVQPNAPQPVAQTPTASTPAAAAPAAPQNHGLFGFLFHNNAPEAPPLDWANPATFRDARVINAMREQLHLAPNGGVYDTATHDALAALSDSARGNLYHSIEATVAKQPAVAAAQPDQTKPATLQQMRAEVAASPGPQAASGHTDVDSKTAVFDERRGLFIMPDGRTFKAGSGCDSESMNNPSMERSLAEGPIPRGTWNVGVAGSHTFVRDSGAQETVRAMYLSPAKGTNSFGRSGIFLHQSLNSGNFTNGCVAVNGQDIQAISEARNAGLFTKIMVVEDSSQLRLSPQMAQGRDQFGHSTKQVASNISRHPVTATHTM